MASHVETVKYGRAAAARPRRDLISYVMSRPDVSGVAWPVFSSASWSRNCSSALGSAPRHGRSLEAEHREILRAAVASEICGQDLYDLLRRSAVFDEQMKPEDWRLPDPGKPAEL
jgi:hypothetical protein